MGTQANSPEAATFPWASPSRQSRACTQLSRAGPLLCEACMSRHGAGTLADLLWWVSCTALLPRNRAQETASAMVLVERVAMPVKGQSLPC